MINTLEVILLALIILSIFVFISLITVCASDKKIGLDSLSVMLFFVVSISGLFFGIKTLLYNEYRDNSFSSDLKLKYNISKVVEKNLSSSDLDLLYLLTTTIEESKNNILDYEILYSNVNVEIIRSDTEITVKYKCVENVTKDDFMKMKLKNNKESDVVVKIFPTNDID